MIHRAVEISGTGRHLHKERGFLVISAGKEELARLPLADLEVVLFAGHGATVTSELLNTLAENCIPLVLCDRRFLPASLLWPVESHSLQSGRIQTQAEMTKPMRKRLWLQLVRSKVRFQAEALLLTTGETNARLERLSRVVRPGDPANVEGEAARLYWPLLFGPAFRRDRNQPGVNGLLNYGYTVLRAAVARAVMLAGLHPAFALHHRNLRDTMPLVDDLIEPFRPAVDILVFALTAEASGSPTLDAAAKTRLAEVSGIDMRHEGVASPISECLLRLTRSLAEVCEGRRKKLTLPEGFHDGQDGRETR